MTRTTDTAASASSATPAPRPRLPRSGRHRTSGSFHAGEPFPQLSPYDESLSSRSRRRRIATADARRPLRRQPTAKYHTFPTSPPASPSERQGSGPRSRPSWYERLFGRCGEETSHADHADRDADGAQLNGRATYHDRARERWRGRRPRANGHEDVGSAHATPLPWMQLGLLALLSLAEQTALNSIGPYLPAMVASFDDIPDGQEGLYVGLLASAFALAQLTTNLLWGYLSDRIGRKPVMLLGTSLLTVCFLFFGLCTTYAHLIVVHVAMGLFNGNAAIVPTCLGEVTDRTNQSRAFTWLPVIYSLGSITGPALGGLLAGVGGGHRYPFLAPNVFDAALLLASVVVLAVWFEETLAGVGHKVADNGGDWVRRVCDWCAACWRFVKRRLGRKQAKMPDSRRGNRAELGSDDLHDSSLSSDMSEDAEDDEHRGLLPSARGEQNGTAEGVQEPKSAFRELANRNTLAVLGTYLVFQLANISFNSLYPIFVSSPEPTGRELGPGTIGLSLSFAGLATILFQIFLFQKLKARMGNLGTYRYSLLGMAVTMTLMPWVGYLDGGHHLGLRTGYIWLYGELGVILVLKNICAVGGLSSVMLLITNSAHSHETLGTLNGIAQSLSAAGRSVGPFLAGGLFTLSTRVKPKGEALAWGLFAGVTLLGWLGSWAIHGNGLESADWDDDDSDEGSGDEEAEAGL